MSQTLTVRLHGRPLGTLEMVGSLRSPEGWRFTYLDGLEAQMGCLSLSMPIRSAPYEGAVVRNWFANLLPEGRIKEVIAKRLRIPPSDDFALLAAIGGECAGAVSIGQDSATAADDETDLETLFYLAGDGAIDGAWALAGAPHRLSLAGAQDKLAVVREPDGRLRLPRHDELSTHILKPDSSSLRGLRELEALGLRLAAHVGLNVIDCELANVGGRQALLLARYDRGANADGSPQRLHQEDFCQALGYPSEMKYQSQGGPTLAECAALIHTKASMGPKARQGFLDWVAFCALIGNADAHGKNLAILHGAQATFSLAPLYDLVPTIAFSEREIDRTPALAIGNAHHIDQVDASDWDVFAHQTGYAPRFVRRRVADLAERILVTLPAVLQALEREGADADLLRRRAIQPIEDNARQMLETLARN
jgi:serine/threonine-protein kinase HipA